MNKLKYIIGGILLLLAAGCEKDTEPTNFAPKLSTGEASEIYRVGATWSGSVQKSEGILVKECGILYSTIQSMAEYEEVKIAAEEAASFTVSLQNLTPGTTYYYCTYASSGRSIAKGEVKTFTTIANSAPLFNSLVLEAVDEQSITLSTTLKDEGSSEITVRGFCWKLSESDDEKEPTIADNMANVPLEQLVFTSKIKGLEPLKTYLVRAYAVNSIGVGYGETMTVQTKAATIPILAAITEVNSTPLSVTVESSVVSNGEMPIQEKGFCWSTENEEPTTAHIKKVVEGDDETFSLLIDELKPVTTYYIRAYATNALGTGYSETFTYETPLNFPDLDETTVTEVKPTTAKAASVVISENGSEVTEKGFCLSKTVEEPTIENSKIVVPGTTAAYSVVLTNLESGTTYYIRSYATNSKGTGYGEVAEFTTAVDIGETIVSDITDTDASASAEILTTSDHLAITEKGFCYSSANAVPTVADTKKVSSKQGNDIAANLTGLTANTKYYICAYVVNDKGTYYGAVSEFTTQKGVTIGNTFVSDITQTSATASAEILSDAGREILEKGICYSATNSDPTYADKHVTSVAEGSLIVAAIEGLSSNLKCYVRGYVKNARGYHYGKVTSFVTPSEKAGEPIDLGLSVKWASWNVGASSVEEYGGLYGWGDPTGTATGKGPGVSAGGEISGTEYDIAQAKWGDSWRMPTKAEMEELLNKCIKTTATRNGISGLEFTGPNGNSIFLPNGGSREGTKIVFQGTDSYYWTGTGSSSSHGYTYEAYCMTDGRMGDDDCTSGFSVRPVSDFVTVGETSISGISGTGASVSSSITSNEGLAIVEKGFCYSYLKTPTTDDSKIVSVAGGNGIEADLSDLVPNSQYYVRAYAINSKGGTVYGDKLEFITKDEFPVGEAVDLGLSVKWADMNIGASKPEDNGGYYCWGYTGMWSDYYEPDIVNTPEDISGTQYDIAHVKWGGNWRLPTLEQISELLSRCTLFWTNQNGVNGLLVTGPNGNTIFLPAAGNRSYNLINNYGTEGRYWSSRVYSFSTGNAYCLFFSDTAESTKFQARTIGFSVRAVTD